MRRWRRVTFLVLYCSAIWLLLDFLYTKLFVVTPDHPGVPHPAYHHGFRPNFSGESRWGASQYPLYTNSLGMRDIAVRHVDDKPAGRRVIVIGDSFTEGVGVRFEDTYAGLLYLAGQSRTDKTEYLNAGVVSYSPTLYHRKIKFLLDSGIRFHEVMVFIDISDIQDEATAYFCLDDEPRYRLHCRQQQSSRSLVRAALLDFDARNYFHLSHVLQRLLRYHFRWYFGYTERQLRTNARAGWTIPGLNVGNSYAPLGVEGAIERAKKNMKALADLLAKHDIALTVVVYPWPAQLYHGDRESRQVTIWREFCAANCRHFVNLFPALFAFKDTHPDWYQQLYIKADAHFSEKGHRVVFDELKRQLPHL